MLPIALSDDIVDRLFTETLADAGYELGIDLPAQTIAQPDGSVLSFEIDAFLKERLINGLDQIGLTLRHEEKIAAFEKAAGA